MPLSEFDVIRKYFKPADRQTADVRCGIGDDAAIVRLPEGMELAIAMDTLVAGVHFPLDTAPEDIGFKLLAVNLSDMAAMGAKPAWATLALTLPEADSDWLAGFMQGFNDLAGQYSVSLIGGDLSRGPLTISLQIHGYLPQNKGMLRSGAREGDLIYVSGTLGDAGLALKVLNRELEVDPKYKPLLFQRLNRPEPRIELGETFRDIAHSAIDISDGLLADLGHIIEDSHVGAVVNTDLIPLSEALAELDTAEALQLALTAGDDYELCLTVAEDMQASVDQTATEQCPLTCIGKITSPGKGIQLEDADGRAVRISGVGYRHF